MRLFSMLAAVLLLTAGPVLAQNSRTQAMEWLRMPTQGRTAYLTGAAAGANAYAESQPGEHKLARVRIDMAVADMNSRLQDPLARQQSMMALAWQVIQANQDKGIPVSEAGGHVRDAQFDQRLLFDYPWLYPVNLEAFVPMSQPKPTFAQTWLAAQNPLKLFFLEGFGDMVAERCLARFGDTPKGNACLKPLLPMPIDAVATQMDAIYRDPRYAHTGYDLVARAALLRMVGDDWQSVLNGK